MYLEYFGLQRPPFKITPDTTLFYGGGKRGAVLDALVYAVCSGEGMIKVVGEVGSGKTMLLVTSVLIAVATYQFHQGGDTFVGRLLPKSQAASSVVLGPVTGAKSTPASSLTEPKTTLQMRPQRDVLLGRSERREPASFRQAALNHRNIQASVEATLDWIRRAPNQHYSIQLLTVGGDQGAILATDLEHMADVIALNRIHIYEKVVNDVPMFGVLYDEYSSREKALAALEALPDRLRSNRPYLRSLRRLKAEVSG